MSDDADQLFDRGDELSGQGARALADGRVEEGRALFRQAIDAYRSALASVPEGDALLAANLKLCIGARRFGLGQLDRARARYEEVIAGLAGHPDPEGGGEAAELLAQARLNLAEVVLTEGDARSALAEVRAVEASCPGHPYALLLRERCELALGI